MSLKNKILSGLLWVFSEQVGNKLIQFIIGIILARLLMPSVFGLMGMILIFVTISESIASGGFVHALIRKQNCSKEDFETAFFFNCVVSCFLYFLIFSLSPLISDFYEEKELLTIVRLVCLVILFDAVAFVQRAKLIKNLNFRRLAKVSLFSQILSGGFGIYAAYNGYGVYSLVLKIVINRLVVSITLILISRWVPRFKFSKSSFRELFGFGSKIFLTQIIERAYQNIYHVIIGKFFGAEDLGYYTRANMFKNLFSEQMTTSIQQVTLPALSKVQKDEDKLKKGFYRLADLVLFSSSFFLIGLIPISGSMIYFLLGEKWHESILYLQLLAASTILYPIGEINLNILQVKGRSDHILKLQIIKKLFSIPLIIAGVIFGIKYLIIGIIIASIFNFFANSYYSEKLIGYSSRQQIFNSLPSLLIMSIIAFLTSHIDIFFNRIPIGLLFLIQTLFYTGANIFIFEAIKSSDYFDIKAITKYYFFKLLNIKNSMKKNQVVFQRK